MRARQSTVYNFFRMPHDRPDFVVALHSFWQNSDPTNPLAPIKAIFMVRPSQRFRHQHLLKTDIVEAYAAR